MRAEITLVLGGARSGKSEVAERRASSLAQPVTYVATGPAPEGDPEWAERIRRHRHRRPHEWVTVELGPGGDLGPTLRSLTGPILVDSLGTWVAGMDDFGAGRPAGSELVSALEARRAEGHATIVVSEEVGLGVHPSTQSGRAFRDALGTLNGQVSGCADAVLLVVAGRVLDLGPSVAP